MSDLEPKISVSAAIAKGAISQLPILGPVISELINQAIPDRRIERLNGLFQRLEERVANLEPQTIRDRFSEPVFIDLMEDAMFSSVRAVSSERLEYISQIVGRGLNAGDAARIDRKSLLRLLDQLNDAEVLLLCYYGKTGNAESQSFYEVHKETFEVPSLTFGDTDPEKFARAAVRGAYEERLLGLGLVEMRYWSRRKEEALEFDEHGRLKGGHPEISLLGRILLKEIGQPTDFF